MSGLIIRERSVYFTIGCRRYKQVETLIDVTPPTLWCALCDRPYAGPVIDLTKEDAGPVIDLTSEDNQPSNVNVSSVDNSTQTDQPNEDALPQGSNSPAPSGSTSGYSL